MFRKLCSSLLTVCALSVPAFGAEKVYIVATDAMWPPMEMVNDQKQVVGYSSDYINAVAKEAGIKVEIRNTAWDGIFAALGSQQADIIASSVTITDKRKKNLGFSDPYYEIHQAVIVPIDSPIKTMAELDGKNVGGQIGTSGLIETLPKANSKAVVKTYDDVGLAIEDLARGNLDAVIADDTVAKYYANMKQEYKGKLRIAFVPEDAEYYGFAVRLKDTGLRDTLNAGIKAVKEKGIDKEIAKKWLGE